MCEVTFFVNDQRITINKEVLLECSTFFNNISSEIDCNNLRFSITENPWNHDPITDDTIKLFFGIIESVDNSEQKINKINYPGIYCLSLYFMVHSIELIAIDFLIKSYHSENCPETQIHEFDEFL